MPLKAWKEMMMKAEMINVDKKPVVLVVPEYRGEADALENLCDPAKFTVERRAPEPGTEEYILPYFAIYLGGK